MSNKRVKLDNEIFLNKIQDRFGDRYLILDEFINLKTKLRVKCNKCSNEFIATPSSLIYEDHVDWCEKCRKEKIKSDFIKRVKDTCGDEYVALSEYNNCKEKVLFKHNIESCGNEFLMTPDTFFNGGSRCPICMHRQGADKLFISDEVFKERIKRIHKGRIITNSVYNGNDKKVTITHLDCERTFEVYASDLLQGKGCRYCAGTMQKTHDEFVEQIKEKYGDEYTVLGTYIKAKTNVLIRHNLCGHEWEISPTTILKRRTCPYCNKSNGEKELENFAIHNKLNYKTQDIFTECYYKDYLKFDMSIYNNQNQLLCLIEYDGMGHFEPVQFGGITLEEAEENLKEQKVKDSIKNKYCNDNNFKLLRIKYTDYDNIYKILKAYLLNEFDIKTKIPNIFHRQEMKTSAIKFIDIVDNLPNGIYEVKFFKEMLLKDGQNFSTFISNKSVVKQYMMENNITRNNLYIFVNKFNNDNFSEYVKFGMENDFDFEVFNNIRIMESLKDGTYGKYQIGFKNKATVKSNSYDFYNRFLLFKNIKVYPFYIQINSSEPFSRLDFLMKKRNQEVD